MEEAETPFVSFLGRFPALLLNYWYVPLNNIISGLNMDNRIITKWELAVALTMACQGEDRGVVLPWFRVWVGMLRGPSDSIYNIHGQTFHSLPLGASKSCLPFADDVVLSASLGRDLHLSVEQRLSVNLGWGPKTKATRLRWNEVKWVPTRRRVEVQ